MSQSSRSNESTEPLSGEAVTGKIAAAPRSTEESRPSPERLPGHGGPFLDVEIVTAGTTQLPPDTMSPAIMRGRVLTENDLQPVRRRRVGLPIVLFLMTCLSTFCAGATRWQPLLYMGHSLDFRRVILRNWDHGLIYMGCVLAILLAHEMGHFVATLIYRIPASLPMFIPFPFTPIGTMGAVIAMDGRSANRREIFDVGLAGPLAGLLVAIPILWIGIGQMNMNLPSVGTERYDCPLLVEWMSHWQWPDKPALVEIRASQINAYFMAGWVGLLITGLNMLPVSHLDGGHVTYSLFGRRAHWIARIFVFLAILFAVFGNAIMWSPMIVLVILLGTDHPPTADDSVRLGTFRTVLGFASLLIPVLCFPPHGIIIDAF